MISTPELLFRKKYKKRCHDVNQHIGGIEPSPIKPISLNTLFRTKPI